MTTRIEAGPLAVVKMIDPPRRTAAGQWISIRRLKNGKYRYRLTNMREVRAGDRIVLRIKGDLEPRINGPVGVCNPPRRSSGNRYVLYVFDSGALRIKVRGAPRSRVQIPVRLPFVVTPQRRLLGPLMANVGVPDALKLHPYDSYFLALDKIVIGTGCNYLSVCPIAHWAPFDFGDPFEEEGGKLDLLFFSEKFRRMFTSFLWRAARAGVVVHIYPFEFVSFNHPEHWARSPLNAANNVNNWINPDPNEFAAHGPAFRNLRNYHKFHIAIRDNITPTARQIVENYYHGLAHCIDLRHHHALVSVLEGRSRTVDLKLSAESRGRLIGTNHEALYGDSFWSVRRGGPASMVEILKTDARWRQLLDRCRFAVLHHCDSGGDTTRRVGRLMPFARELDFGLLGSTDGTGLGGDSGRHRRPRGSRPNAADIRAIHAEGIYIADDRYLGTEVKMVEGWEAAQDFLRALAGSIDLKR